MSEISERDQEKLDEGRALRAESQTLLPLIATKTALAVGRLIHAYREGQNERIHAIAGELSILKEMESTISQKIKVAEGLERKIFDGE